MIMKLVYTRFGVGFFGGQYNLVDIGPLVLSKIQATTSEPFAIVISIDDNGC